MKYIVGPSHIHTDYTRQIQNDRTLFNDCILDGYHGIPIWSRHIYNCIRDNVSKGNEIVWIVSDYKFNNFNYPEILYMKASDELCMDVMGHSGNVSRDFLCEHHIETLGNHSLKVIDFVLEQFPNVKLIFWCLYKRTKATKNSSYPKHLWYDAVKERYSRNIIDIDLFTNPDEFNSVVLDSGGHPNRDGFILLDRMVRSDVMG